jgi:hypothetical protein
MKNQELLLMNSEQTSNGVFSKIDIPILTAIYLQYLVSYFNLEEMILEQGDRKNQNIYYAFDFSGNIINFT